MCGRSPLGIELAQEQVAALLFVGLPDGACRQLERVQGAQEAAVGLVAPADVARAAPAGGAQRVEAAVVAHPGEGVALDGVLGQLGQVGPGLQAAGSRAATAATASRRRSGGRDRAASRAAATSGVSGSRTVSGLPEVNWTECSGVIGPC